MNCRNCNEPIIRRHGEDKHRFLKRSFCSQPCVLEARGNGKLICRTPGDGDKPKIVRAKAKPPRLGTPALNERMPWPATYSRIEWRMRSSLAAVMEAIPKATNEVRAAIAAKIRERGTKC